MLKLLMVLLFTSSAFAADLKILSWNVFMLSKPIKYSFQEVRSKFIPDQLVNSDYDVMFFQESFTMSFRLKMIAKLKKKYPHSYYLKNNRILFPLMGSGVFVMSRHPFKVLDKIYFNSCGGADCLASKGSFLIETTLPSGKVVQLASTHLQASESLGFVRLQQLGQINEMLKKHARAGVPQFLMGDLNIDVVEPEFQQGLDIVKMKHAELVGPIRHTNGLQNDCYGGTGRNQEWVDHIWMNQEAKIEKALMQVRVFEFEHEGKICPASDHHAVEAAFNFTM